VTGDGLGTDAETDAAAAHPRGGPGGTHADSAPPAAPARRRLPVIGTVLLLAGGAASLLPVISSPVALTLGAAMGLSIGNPHRTLSSRLAGKLLRVCVVGLGFGMSLQAVALAGERGLSYTVAGVLATFAVGLLLGRLLRVDGELSLLVTSGTSICGGSAIAAVGSTIRARGESISAALGVVFILNAAALYIFPAVGHALSLTQTQFAIWAAVAIHDTSSVVAAAAAYGPDALAQATVLKLARTLWILPLTLGVAMHARRRDAATGTVSASAPLPWFILVFLLAVAVRTVSPADLLPFLDLLVRAARAALPLVLFLIGSTLTRASLRAVGPLPFAQAIVLWTLVATTVLGSVLLWQG
jgi:uncharacterized integral membrane protein (TIGR00698 family)